MRTSINSPTLAVSNSADPHSVTIELDGDSVNSLDALADTVSQHLALPAFTTGSPERVASAVDRRLYVMEKASQYVTVVLTNTDAMPKPALAYLLNWVTNTPLRLLLAGDQADSENSVALLRNLDIELLDVEPAEVERPDVEPSNVEPSNVKPSKAEPAQTKPPEVVQRAVIAQEQRSTNRAQTPPDKPDPAIDLPPATALDAPSIDVSLPDAPLPDAPADAAEDAEPTTRRWYLVMGATALTAAVLWYAATDKPAVTSTAKDSTRAAPELPVAESTTSTLTTPTLATPAPPANEATRSIPVKLKPDVAPLLADQPATVPELAREVAPEIATKAAPQKLSTADNRDSAATDALPPAQNQLTATPINGYTLQIGSYADSGVLEQYLLEMPNRPTQLRAAESQAGGRFKNLLVYGAYPDYGSAARAIETLPPALQKGQPFPIKASKLKR